MTAWCPRCDADRPGETTCPRCGTPLATLQAPPRPPEPDAPPPAEEPVQPPAPSRLRVALLVTALVLGGLAFVAGRSGARPEAPAAPAATTQATTTTTPDEDLRELGWRATPSHGITVTAVAIRRIVTPDRETSAELTLRVEGLRSDQRLFAFRELHLFDLGGGVFSTPEEEAIGDQTGTPAIPTGDPATYRVVTAPAPRLRSLATVEVGGLIVLRPRTATAELDVRGAWPAGPPLRAVDPGSRDRVTVSVPQGLAASGRVPIRLAGVLVGGGRAVVALDAREAFQNSPLEAGGTLPLGAELRSGGRVLCSQTVVLRSGDIRSMFGMVLSCRTTPVSRLEVAVGAGVQAVPVDATLER
jgi:hypothetical protein